MENILKIFTSEDEQELKTAFKEIIKEQFKTQLEEMDLYLFDPNYIEELVDQAFHDIISDITAEYKGKIRERLTKAFDKIWLKAEGK